MSQETNDYKGVKRALDISGEFENNLGIIPSTS